MENKNRKKSAMTIDKLARITQDEFLVMNKKIGGLQETVGGLQETVGGLQGAVGGLQEAVIGLDLKIDRFQEEVRGNTATILKSVEKIAGKLDKQEKEDAAHVMLHHRISNTLHDHDKRIKKLEVRV